MSKYIPALDITKFIFAILVVCIHTEVYYDFPLILKDYIITILDVAVPGFFVISSYLFFRKAKDTLESSVLKNYVKRLALLYAFWFILLSPLTFLRKNYFASGFTTGLMGLFKDVILGSTFNGSWFFSALVVAVLIIYYLNKLFDRKIIFLFTIIINVLIRLHTQIESVDSIYNWYLTNIVNLENSFWISLMWVSLGSLFACDRQFYYIQHSQENASGVRKICGIIFMLAFAFAGIIQYRFCLVYIMVPCCILYAFNFDIPPKNIYKIMRNISILIFIIHFVVIVMFRNLFVNVDFLQHGLGQFVIVLPITLLISYIILKLKEVRYFHWLKYSI
jgi:peptidoglycan/LPS O-acetylase OafA/YrhL